MQLRGDGERLPLSGTDHVESTVEPGRGVIGMTFESRANLGDCRSIALGQQEAWLLQPCTLDK